MGQYCSNCGTKLIGGVCPNCDAQETQEWENAYYNRKVTSGPDEYAPQSRGAYSRRRVEPSLIVIMVLVCVIIGLVSFMAASCIYGGGARNRVETDNTAPVSAPVDAAPAPTAPVTEAEPEPAVANGSGTYNNPSCGYFDRNNYYSVGDHLLFGSYEQDANTANGKEAIEWIVLDNQKGKLVLISNYCLDCKSYNNACASLTWDKCTLRTWLNNDFYNTSFSDDEKDSIMLVKNVNANNPNYKTPGGNTTHDKVYCLRIGEVRQYFTDDNSRIAEATLYAQQTDGYKNSDSGRGWWWLRSPGSDNFNAATVLDNGEVFPAGYLLHSTDGCVRPVITIKQ